MRINQFLSSCGLGTRKECDKLIQEGDIKVNGELLKDFNYKVERNDKVEYKGKRVFTKQFDYIVFNKEKSIFSNFTKGEESLISLISDLKLRFMEGLQPLDFEDCGVQILTNDLEILGQEKSLKSVFHVFCKQEVSSELLGKLSFALQSYKDVQLSLLGNSSEIGLELFTSNYKEVKEIFQKTGIEIAYLDRVMVNGITKKDLNRGFFRPATKTEIVRLKHF